MKPLSLGWRAVRELGVRPVVGYGLYQAALRSGWLRMRTPSFAWQDRPLSTWLKDKQQGPEDPLQRQRTGQHPRFLFKVDESLRERLNRVLGDRHKLVTREADAILRGVFPMFGMKQVDLGFPPDWSLSASMERGEPAARWDLGQHWTALARPDGSADVKLLWEPARFASLYSLARAFALTDDRRYAQAAWALIESWRRANPPNRGPHWESGQEAALRVFALVFADAVFGSVWDEGPDRRARIFEMLAVHAARIPPTMLYARVQGNNHLIVEAAGLYTVGLLFPFFEKADTWKRTGRLWLERAFEEQVFEDGGYVQHSFNYQRLALQVGLWSARLAELNGEPLPSATLDRLYNMMRLLRHFTSPNDGRVPNFGPNDGAHVFPWSTCGFLDFRPTIQAGARILAGERFYRDGPWDEASLWFGLDEPGPDTAGEHSSTASSRPADNSVEAQRASYPIAGLHLLAGDRARGLLRCGPFKSRPGHSDQLHFGLWWGAQAVALDAGSYRYEHEPPWDNGLAKAAVHNTLLVDGEDPMRRAGRFLWLDWAQGRILGRWRSREGGLELLAAQHDGYHRWGLAHRRSVIRAGEEIWLVVDDLLGHGEHEANLGWLLHEGRWEWSVPSLKVIYDNMELALRVEAEAPQVGVYRAGEIVAGKRVSHESLCWGWHSPTYALKEPALRLVASVRSVLPLRICSWWSFNQADPGELEIAWWEEDAPKAPVEELYWNGEHLNISDAYLIGPSSVRGVG